MVFLPKFEPLFAFDEFRDTLGGTLRRYPLALTPKVKKVNVWETPVVRVVLGFPSMGGWVWSPG